MENTNVQNENIQLLFFIINANTVIIPDKMINPLHSRIDKVFKYDHVFVQITSFMLISNSYRVIGTSRIIPVNATDCEKHCADCMLFKFDIPLIIGIIKI